MIITKGMVVMATAGKECDRLFVVTETNEKFAMIADGKKRKLANPKKKSLKHLRFTDNIIEMNDMTDKKLRNVLRTLSTP
jgi:ribosomal protein L14E/L6E/L27E